MRPGGTQAAPGQPRVEEPLPTLARAVTTAETGVSPSPVDLQLPSRLGWAPALNPPLDTRLVPPWKVSLAARDLCAVAKRAGLSALAAPRACECAPHGPEQLEH